MPFATVPTIFEWPAGPSSVKVSGDWDQWADKLELKRSADGSFKAELDLPEKTKFLFKFIVDDVWQTKPGFPTERDGSSNENNVLTTGEAEVPAKDEPAAPAEASTSQAIEIPDNSVPNTPALSSDAAAWPLNKAVEEDTQSSLGLSSSPSKPALGGVAATVAGGIAGASAGAVGIAAMFGSSPEKRSLDIVGGSGAKKSGIATPVKAVADGQVGAVPASAASTLSKAQIPVSDTVGTQTAGQDALRGAPVAVDTNGKKEAKATPTAAPQAQTGAPAPAAALSSKDSKPVPVAYASINSAPSGHAKGSSTAASSATAVSTSGTSKETTTAAGSTISSGGKEKEPKRGSIFGTLSRSRRKSSTMVLAEAEQAASDAAKAKGADVPPVPAVPQSISSAGIAKKATVTTNGSSTPSKPSQPVPPPAAVKASPAPAPAPAPVTPKKSAPVPASKKPVSSPAAQTPEKKSGSGFLGKIKKGLTPKKGSSD